MPEASEYDKATKELWGDATQEWGSKAEDCEEPNWEKTQYQDERSRLLKKCAAEGNCTQGHKLENVRATKAPGTNQQLRHLLDNDE